MKNYEPFENSQQIRDEIARLQIEKDSIDDQLRVAKSEAARTGLYDDQDWFLRATHASKVKGRMIGMLQQELGVMIKEEKKKRLAESRKDVSFESLFMFAAREILPRSLYDTVMRDAMRREADRDSQV